MTKYESTGETTDDPAVAVGWGVWRDDEGHVLRVDGRVLQVLNGGWMRTRSFGVGRLERMRVVVEPRSGAELRRWLVAHPGVGVTYAQEGTLGLVLWDPGRAEYRGAAYEGCSCSVFCGPWKHDMKPADGGGWAR